MKRLEPPSKANEKTEEKPPPKARRELAKDGPDASNHPMLDLQRQIGNQGVLRLLKSGAIQTKLQVSQPGDADEVEADRIAAAVTASHAETGIDRKAARETAEIEQGDGIARNEKFPTSGELSIRDDLLDSLGPGQPLAPGVREPMEARFGRGFEDVRVHTDRQAADSALSLNARAFTAGDHLVFGTGEFAPQTSSGKLLLAHELTHVAQQGTPGNTKKVQRRVHTEDVSSEMIGRQFTVTKPFRAGTIQLQGGETVTVVAWSNASLTVTVQLTAPYLNAYIPFDVPKHLLTPVSPSVKGIAPYRAGVGKEERAIEKGERAIATEQTRKGGPRPGEIPRLESLQKNRERELNKRLIQETMLNRFDPIIQKWVDFYNRRFGFVDKNAAKALDPNLLKSMLFQESQMGTAGKHLEIDTPGHPISHPVRSRFNLAQVIDSSGAALLLIIREVQPALITTHHLENISHDLSTAQTELQHLKSLAHPNDAQRARIAVLDGLAHPNWEPFLWGYKAPGQATGFFDAVQALFASAGSGQPALNLDYDFWIRAAVRWIFEKRRSVGSWVEAIRAYNGSGAGARDYRDAIVQRAEDAKQAQAAGTDFTPPGL